MSAPGCRTSRRRRCKMSASVVSYLEAMLLLLPPEAGGRETAVAPREGSYCPYAVIDDRLARLRLLEGPPRLAPGEEARVVLEVEGDVDVRRGEELRVVELDHRVVGLATILRVCTTVTV